MKLPAVIRPRGRHRATPAPAFNITDLVPGTRWLVCETTTCAHLTRRHTPTPTGYRCTSCSTTKGQEATE